MDAPGTVPESINCHQCNTLIDLAGQAAFTQVECGHCGALSVVPLKFGNFLLLNALGVGGMGTVYKAIDLSLHRYLAIKILRKKLAADPQFLENFAREARAAASVNHPNVAQVYSFGEQDGQYYLAMELLERGSLDERIVRLDKLPEKDVLEIGAQIAGGLRAAQQRGLLHRDIKPGNILFNDEGVPKLVDFGLARAQHETPVDEPGAVWGTPYYIAPEKLRGQPEDFPSDMYSLGASLFHALAGRPPFEAETTSEVVSKHATTPAFSLKTFAPDVQDFTADIIGRMLAKNPAERYASYDLLIHDLHEAERRLRQVSTEPAIVAETGERISIASIIGTLAALAVCGVVIWYVVKNRAKLGLESKPSPPVAMTNETRVAPAAVEDANFNSDEAWVKSWSVATLQLTQGRFNDALFGYDGALYQVGHTRPRARQWIYFYEAVTLITSDRPDEARKLLTDKAKDAKADPHVTLPVTVTNFINSLIAVSLDELPAEEFDQPLPSWANGLAQLTIGFKQLEAGKFAPARDAFRAYHKAPVDDTQRWAFNLQPLADRLGRDCDRALHDLAEIDTLEKEHKPGTALEFLQTLKAKTRLPALRAALTERETRLQQLIDEQPSFDPAAELQQLNTIDAAVAAAAKTYDFKTALAKIENSGFQPATTAVQQQLEQRRALVRLLVEFKTQFAADIQRRPYDGVGMPGKLSRVTDTELVFITPYGELVRGWSDLSPDALMKIAESYAGTSPRRYLTLAAFAKQFGSDRVAAYLKLATPAMQPEIDAAFGETKSR